MQITSLLIPSATCRELLSGGTSVVDGRFYAVRSDGVHICRLDKLILLMGNLVNVFFEERWNMLVSGIL